VLALAGRVAVAQGGEHPERREHPGVQIGERHAGRHRAVAADLAGEAHDAAHRLGDQGEAAAVAVGAVEAED
jgi:hypothetical protein